jgi:cytochrome c biogenesis protein CcmG/thiol:disulfide interchange protein DsbE
MAALEPGAKAPDITLPTLDGGKFSLPQDKPTLAVFYKASCPTCQYALPYWERLFQAVRKAAVDVAFVGVSQDDAVETRDFARRFGLSFPILRDPDPRYAVSNAYGLTNVPTVFLIEDGVIEFSGVGWARQDYEEIARRLLSRKEQISVPLFAAGESVADFKAG